MRGCSDAPIFYFDETEILGNANLLNSAIKYYCKICHDRMCKKSSFDDRNLSSKHKMETESKQIDTRGNAFLPKEVTIDK